MSSIVRSAQDWLDRQDERSFRGVVIGAWRRYVAVDGPLQSALLSLYVLVAVVPALLVMEEYLESNPAALSNHIVEHFGLSAATGGLVQSVLVHTRSHELGSALFAVASALFFGLGFGRVLQLVHIRAWQLELPRRETDQIRFAIILCGVYGLVLALLVELTELGGGPSWAEPLTMPGWLLLMIGFFVWAPRLLTHKLISRRDLLPGAVLTALSLAALIAISRYELERWVDLYARDYGGLGVVMAMYFWILIGSSVIVVAAALSPPLARRRTLRHPQR